jgi:hypothetical protein
VEEGYLGGVASATLTRTMAALGDHAPAFRIAGLCGPGAGSGGTRGRPPIAIGRKRAGHRSAQVSPEPSRPIGECHPCRHSLTLGFSK